MSRSHYHDLFDFTVRDSRLFSSFIKVRDFTFVIDPRVFVCFVPLACFDFPCLISVHRTAIRERCVCCVVGDRSSVLWMSAEGQTGR